MKINDQNLPSPPPSRGTLTAKPSSGTSQLNSEKIDLSQGRLIKGQILSTSADGTVRISIGGKSLTAQSLVPLTVGQDIWLEVIQGGRVPLLGLAARKGAALDVMRQLLGFGSSGWFSIGGEDLALLDSKIPSENSHLSQFTTLFQKSRLGPEADPGKLLRTVQLLGLNKQGSENPPESVINPANKDINELLKIFATHGQLNSQPTGQNQQNFLLFPCFFAGSCGWGEWMLSLDDERADKQDERGNYNLTFFLEMSSLGEIHINIQTRRNALHGVFSLPNEKSLAFLNKSISELSSLLEKLGYKTVTLSAQLSSTTNFQTLKDALSSQTGNNAFTLLDTTV